MTRLLCQTCASPLRGRAKRWCSPNCASKGWAATHRASRNAAQLRWRRPLAAKRIEAAQAQAALQVEQAYAGLYALGVARVIHANQEAD